MRGNENKIAGLVDLKGNVLAVRENIIGKLDADKKTLRDKGGEIIGYMKNNNFAFDKNNEIIGYVMIRARLSLRER